MNSDKRKIPKADRDPKDALVKCLQLSEVSLNDVNLIVERSRVNQRGTLNIDFNVDASFETENDGKIFVASCGCKVQGSTLENKKIFDLSIEYFLKYGVIREFDWPAEEVKFFSDRNVIIHVWPYLREYIDQTSARANLNRVVLPLLPPNMVPNSNSDPKK